MEMWVRGIMCSVEDQGKTGRQRRGCCCCDYASDGLLGWANDRCNRRKGDKVDG